MGLDINSRDRKGSTPLHWACFSKSEIALNYLLAWKPELNFRDSEGYTPLHLAIKIVDDIGSLRPVKALLIRGARKDIKDNWDRLPIDLIEEVENIDLANELKIMLVNFLFKIFRVIKENANF